MKCFEVERKFHLTTHLLSKFKQNLGTPSFDSISHKSARRFVDTYYDRSDALSSNGLWIRKRDITWEAKKRISGNFTQSVFDETSDPIAIQEMINKYVPTARGMDLNFGLDVLCRFETKREEYLIDEKYTVALDTTDFGHAVGEVELIAQDPSKAEREIGIFMDHYQWFFKQGTPKGKLVAYFEKFKNTVK